MKYIILLLFLTGCANMPTKYGDMVYITSGKYKDKIGRLVGDCSGIENYKVELDHNKFICIHSWDMELL